MTTVDPDGVLVRVEKGHASEEELAAIAVVLLTRVVAPDVRAGCAVPLPPRPRTCAYCVARAAAFRAPRSWQAAVGA